MELESLHDSCLNKLHDLYDAENQIVKALPKMIEAATSDELRNALSNHLEQTHAHVTRLEQIFQLHNEEVSGEKCNGRQGIIDEGKRPIKHDENLDVHDAAIVSAGQKLEQYEMAR
jgi:ferritin-like metal-binding protein YciE